jgi:stage V sporulation protein SpoVS
VYRRDMAHWWQKMQKRIHCCSMPAVIQAVAKVAQVRDTVAHNGFNTASIPANVKVTDCSRCRPL